MQIKLVLVFTAVLFQLGNAHGGVHVISELTDPAFLLAGAVVAEDAVVYIAGNGVAAVNVSSETTILSTTSPSLRWVSKEAVQNEY